jgi:hypothetical protein
VLNKVGAFVANPLVRNIVGQKKSAFNIRQIMDEGKILLVNLSRGQVGEDNAAILGALMVTKIQLAAMSRADMPLETAARSTSTSTSSKTSPPTRSPSFCLRPASTASTSPSPTSTSPRCPKSSATPSSVTSVP